MLNKLIFLVPCLFVLIGINMNLYGQTVQSPTISHSSGFYSNEFQLHIIPENKNDIILYTLDGSAPHFKNLKGKAWSYKLKYQTQPEDAVGELINDTIWTLKYSAPIPITDIHDKPDKFADISTSYLTNDWYYENVKSLEHPVFKGICMRIVAYRDGHYSEEITRNFFIGENNRYSLPIICLAVEPDLFYGYKEGINVPGIDYDTWRLKNPDTSLDTYDNIMYTTGNFRRSGSETESKINFTYLINGKEVLNHGAGIRINGNTSRFFPNRSLRLYAKSKYGPKNFNYPFFQDSDENKFKRLLLRNAGGDSQSTYLRDAFIQESSKNLNTITQGYQPAIVFINGEYNGLYNLRERYDTKYFKQYFGIDKDSLDHIAVDTVKEGSSEAFEELYQFMKNNDFTNDSILKELSYRIDIENFIDYYIVETFMGNRDWPSNNHELWRKKVNFDSTASYGSDGRWRWILKDFDAALGSHPETASYDSNDFKQFREASGNIGLDHLILPFVNAMKNVTFLNQFINRYCDILNSTYKTDVLNSNLDKMANMIAPEMVETTRRWNPENKALIYYWPNYSKEKWMHEISFLQEYITNRTFWIRKHLNDEYQLGEEKEISLDISKNKGGFIQINSLKIDENLSGVNQENLYPWTGIYYTKVPIKLTAKPNPGYEFSHWSGKASGTSNEITLYLGDVNYIKANFKRKGQAENEDDNLSVLKNLFSNSITLGILSLSILLTIALILHKKRNRDKTE